MKELEIGEIGEIDGVKVRCVKEQYCEPGCSACCFNGQDCIDIPSCNSLDRLDKTDIIYKAVTE